MKSIKVSFLLLNSKQNTRGLSPIYIRIKLNGNQINLSTNEWISSNDWNKSKSKVKGTDHRVIQINNNLKQIEEKVYAIANDARYEGKELTLDLIKERLKNNGIVEYTIISLFDYYIHYIQSHLNNGYAKSTLGIYESSKKKIQAFLKTPANKCHDLKLSKLNYDFINRYDAFLSSPAYNNKANTIAKEMKRLKAVVHYGMNLGWIETDPFKKYKSKSAPTNRQYLSKEELQAVEDIDTADSIRLSLTKDLFSFMAYTGISYSDMVNLSHNNISVSINGRLVLTFCRKKTDEHCRVPILDKTKQIIDRYADHPVSLNRQKLLPAISNQKLNKNLKVLAALAGIDKPLTCHIARHTFATMSLENGIPIETVSKVLGHTQLKTTQIYAKITMKKIDDDYQVMNSILNRPDNINLQVM